MSSFVQMKECIGGHFNPFRGFAESIMVFLFDLCHETGSLLASQPAFVTLSISQFFLFYWKMRNSSVFKVASFEIYGVTLHSFIPACKQVSFFLKLTYQKKQPAHASNSLILKSLQPKTMHS